MSSGGDYLDEIVEQLEQGKRPRRRGDKLLGAFGYVRRRQTVIDTINRELESRRLQTNPAITTTFPLDKSVRFFRIRAEGESFPSGQGEDFDEISEPEEESVSREAPYVPVTIGNWDSADIMPNCVGIEDPVCRAITKMEAHRCSHLVVKDKKGRVKGVVSLQSVVKGQTVRDAQKVKDCLDVEIPRVKLDSPLAETLEYFPDNDAVLVFRDMDDESSLCGLVTLADFAREFREIAEPFLLIGEIESRLRWIIQHKNVDANGILQKTVLTKEPKDKKIQDLTLGDMQRILENKDGWRTIDVKYERNAVREALDEVRKGRNRVMHFRESTDENSDASLFRNFRSLLRSICEAVE